jgi:hypothetical protein
VTPTDHARTETVVRSGDLYVYRDERFGHHRFYGVVGVFLGAAGREGLVELRSLTEKPGCAYGRDAPATTTVPEPLLRGVPLYGRVLREG